MFFIHFRNRTRVKCLPRSKFLSLCQILQWVSIQPQTLLFICSGVTNSDAFLSKHSDDTAAVKSKMSHKGTVWCDDNNY